MSEKVVENLKDRNAPEWPVIAERVVAALLRTFGSRKGGISVEQFAQAALQTCWRRLDQGCDPTLEGIQDINDLIGWLIRVARHRGLDALRRAEREREKRRELERRREGPAQESQSLTADVAENIVAEFAATLVLEEKLVLQGMLEGQSDAAVANRIAAEAKERKGKCSRTTAQNLRKQLEKRLKEWAEKELAD
jgi:DNA-directed RNA polymerase specialized sigma24 family protein